MSDEATRDLEEFIDDWYWDEKSHQFARELGRYLFQFIDQLKTQGLSEKTIRKHTDNCWCLGSLETQYGHRGEFSPAEIFCSPEALYEVYFMHKISDSEYAVKSYRSTWRKLYKYTKALGYLDNEG